MSLLAVAAIVAIGAATAGVAYQTIGGARDRRRFQPPGRLIDVSGRPLHAVVCGRGAPAVVLESAIAASSLSWSRVQPAVGRFTTVCAYDRPGLGWSAPPVEPLTLARVLEDLETLTTRVECRPPFVLVGHSFGAFVALAFAAAHPDRVAGLVLVDPPTDWIGMDRRQTYLLRGARQLSRLGALLARVGIVRACLALLTGGAPAAPRYFVKVFGPTTARTLERLVGEVRKLPPDVHPLVEAAWCQPKCFGAMAGYLRVFEEAAASAGRDRPAADVPLTVISGGDQPPAVVAAQRALADTSSLGRHVVAAKSGHWIPFDEPDLIVDAIQNVVTAIRQRQS